MTSEPSRVLLYDGACASCNRALRLLDARLPASTPLVFMPLSSPRARLLLQETPGVQDRDALVLVGDAGVTQGAAAVRELLRLLPRWRWLGSLLEVMPDVVTEGAYDLFAANRHRWNRHLTNCELGSSRMVSGAAQ